MKIPEGFIEDADIYSVCIAGEVNKTLEIGGRVMFNLMVRDQMDPKRILATAGTEHNERQDMEKSKSKMRCLIIVDYTEEEVMKMYTKAKGEVERMVKLGLGEEVSN